MKQMQTDGLPALVARVLLSAIFLVSGFAKIADWNGTAEHMASQHMPMVPLFLVLAIVCEVGGGLMLLLGFKTRFAAVILFLYLIPVTLVFHHFWTLSGAERLPQMVNFMKNLAILGGLAEVFAFGAGRLSVDHRLAHRTPRERFLSQPAHA